MNPSFNFTWDTSKKEISGKVFARKRQQLKNDKVSNETQSRDSSKTQTSESVNTNECTRVSQKNAPVKRTSETHPDFIKRKRKKIKNQPPQPQDLEDEFDSFLDRNVNTTTKNPKKSFSLFNQKPKHIYVNTPSGKSVSEEVFTNTGHTFSDIKQIHKHVLSNLTKHGFVKMTTVQQKAIPVILSGQNTLVSRNAMHIGRFVYINIKL